MSSSTLLQISFSTGGAAVSAVAACKVAAVDNTKIDSIGRAYPEKSKKFLAFSDVTGNHLSRRFSTSARKIPLTAFTSREDHPVLVKIVRMVFFVDWVRDGGWK